MFSHWMSTASAAAANSAGNAAPPPDVLIEVGPPPFVRYAAHSALLAAHSGYLRSALRTPTQQFSDCDDNATGAANSSPIIYVPNITADQFGPLLTYMYTGYLDLNGDNIFAVLLATHVLHMPRAADICRTYLTRTSSSNSSNIAHAHAPPSVAAFGPVQTDANANVHAFGTRIVRPIASKAPLGGVAFAAPLMSTRLLLPSKDTPFKVLLQQIRVGQTSTTGDGVNPSPTPTTALLPECNTVTSVPSPVIVQKEAKKRRRSASSTSPSANRCKTESVFVKSATARQSPLVVQIGEVLDDPVRFTDALKLSHACGGGSSSVKKTIVDIASCDGPVRFRRVLNEAYGLARATGSDDATSSTGSTSLGPQRLPVERNAQLVATSFHLQMAKTISGEMRMRNQQQQSKSSALAAPCSESESENSQQEINVSSEATNPEPPTPSPIPATTRATTTTSADELYVCVYCKHTFKSQYCFQKHAKRHINPLTIDDSEMLLKSVQQLVADESDDADGGAESGGRKQTGAATTVVRREVRPLDMNVQYYPCKTCGSKFPSYYFVHKHRKLCHANEDN